MRFDKKSFIQGIVIGLVIIPLLFAFGIISLQQHTFAKSSQNQKTVCFCHNKLHNPHTICTAEQGLINGHKKHVQNGTDSLGACKVPTGTISVTPTRTPTPTVTPTDTPTKTPTLTPTNTPTKTPTVTPTNTPTKTPTLTPTNTPTNTPTPTP